VLKRLTPLGMSLEIELGVTGGEEERHRPRLKEGECSQSQAVHRSPKTC